jgi:heat shock protein 90kDa beta
MTVFFLFLTGLHMYISGDKNEENEKEIKQEYSQTCDWIKKRLGDKVARVDISNRLSSSPCVLVAAKFGWSANMER